MNIQPAEKRNGQLGQEGDQGRITKERDLKHKGAVLQISEPGEKTERLNVTSWLGICRFDEHYVQEAKSMAIFLTARKRKAAQYFEIWDFLPSTNDRILHYLPEGKGEGKPEEQFHVCMVGPAGFGSDYFGYVLSVEGHTVGVQ